MPDIPRVSSEPIDAKVYQLQISAGGGVTYLNFWNEKPKHPICLVYFGNSTWRITIYCFDNIFMFFFVGGIQQLTIELLKIFF